MFITIKFNIFTLNSMFLGLFTVNRYKSKVFLACEGLVLILIQLYCKTTYRLLQQLQNRGTSCKTARWCRMSQSLLPDKMEPGGIELAQTEKKETESSMSGNYHQQ